MTSDLQVRPQIDRVVINNKKPIVTIISPQDGANISKGDVVKLDGTATTFDKEFIVNPDAYVWNSDKDGLLGTGAVISTGSLSSGQHKITLQVKDKDGAVNTAKITIYIF